MSRLHESPPRGGEAAIAPPLSAREEGPPAPGANVLEKKLESLLQCPDERGFGAIWQEVQDAVRELALRPAKRVRPRLLVLGYRACAESDELPGALWHFAAGLEVTHTFLLVHDDIADRSDLRRGGATLHRSLRGHGVGEDLATVAGDHLFARAMELLLTTELPEARRATLYFLGICRHTAVGQYLDLSLSRRPLADVSAFDAIRVAQLKTAKYSFAAPLACGAMLAGASAELATGLERAGRFAGLAFQLQDDLLGIFGDARASGKPGDGDLAEGKRTYPLLIAYRRASSSERAHLDALGTTRDPSWLAEAQRIVRARGGESATERLIARSTRAALAALGGLGLPAGRTAAIAELFENLGRR